MRRSLRPSTNCDDPTPSFTPRPSKRDGVEQVFNAAGAIGESFQRNPDLVQQRQMQIGKRFWLLVPNVAPASKLTCSAPSHQDWKVRVVVRVGIAHSTSIEENRNDRAASRRLRESGQVTPKTRQKAKHGSG